MIQSRVEPANCVDVIGQDFHIHIYLSNLYPAFHLPMVRGPQGDIHNIPIHIDNICISNMSGYELLLCRQACCAGQFQEEFY